MWYVSVEVLIAEITKLRWNNFQAAKIGWSEQASHPATTSMDWGGKYTMKRAMQACETFRQSKKMIEVSIAQQKKLWQTKLWNVGCIWNCIPCEYTTGSGTHYCMFTGIIVIRFSWVLKLTPLTIPSSLVNTTVMDNAVASYYWQLDGLLNKLFRLTTKMIPKLNITDSSVENGFSSQRASNSENAPMSQCFHSRILNTH